MVTMCIAWATPTAMTMIGTHTLTGVSLVPNQPATPIVLRTMKTTMTTMERVAYTERRRKAKRARMTRNTTGISFTASFPASVKVWLRITLPVRK